MTMSPKHQKILSAASRPMGCAYIYPAELSELRAAGLIEMRIYISAVGDRSFRWFLRAA